MLADNLGSFVAFKAFGADVPAVDATVGISVKMA
jgi:hypothetical protein